MDYYPHIMGRSCTLGDVGTLRREEDDPLPAKIPYGALVLAKMLP